jgi:hypothetical protein
MSTVPKITVADDPLSSTADRAASPSRHATMQAAQKPSGEPAAASTGVPDTRNTRSLAATSLTAEREAAFFLPASDPPPLDERLELVSARLPASLARRPALMAGKLRERTGIGSQKALPAQELIAALVWTMGHPDDPEAVDGLERVLRAYRGRRYAQAGSLLVRS